MAPRPRLACATMGLFDSGAARSRARQRTSMIDEATAAGCQVVEVFDSADAATATSMVAGTLKVLFGGRVTSDFHQVVVLRTGPLTHAYVQPYQGIQPQPGEHHALLTGTLPVPATLRRRLLGAAQWEGGHGQHVFNHVPAIVAASGALVWTWKAGFTEITLPWGAQVRPAGGATAHLTMLAGRYGGLTSYQVGFGVFVKLAFAIRSALVQGAELPGQDFAEAVAYAPIAAALAPG